MTHAATQPLESKRSARPSRPWVACLVPALALTLGLGMTRHADAAVPQNALCIIGQSYTNGSCGIDFDGTTGLDIQVFVNSQATTPFAYLNGLKAGLTFLGLSNNSSSLKRLNVGDIVDAAAFSAGGAASLSYVYGKGSTDQWASIGDTGYAGFRVANVVNGNTVYNYGYIGLTRGSLTINSVAYQSTAGSAAQIPGATANATVPEPASLALVVAAAGGMLAARRRKAGAAATR